MTATAGRTRRVVGATGRLRVNIGESMADRGDDVVLTARDTDELARQAALAPDVRVNIVELGIVSDPEADRRSAPPASPRDRSQLDRFGTSQEVVHVVTVLLDATWATREIWGSGR